MANCIAIIDFSLRSAFPIYQNPTSWNLYKLYCAFPFKHTFIYAKPRRGGILSSINMRIFKLRRSGILIMWMHQTNCPNMSLLTELFYYVILFVSTDMPLLRSLHFICSTVIQNVQVSDTTGDAMKCKSSFNKNIYYYLSPVCRLTSHNAVLTVHHSLLSPSLYRASHNFLSIKFYLLRIKAAKQFQHFLLFPSLFSPALSRQLNH
jgi:hypothetical protein